MSSSSSNWFSARLDLQQLLRRADQHEMPAHASQKRRDVPELGLLCRTVIRSSMVKDIIPARLRRQSQLELLFVCENHIDVKEVVEDDQTDYQLRHLKTIPFSPDQIRSVGIIGRATKPTSAHDGDAFPDIKQEPEEYPIQVLAVALNSGILQLLTYDSGSGSGSSNLLFKTKSIPLPLVIPPHASSHGRQVVVDGFSRAIAVAAAFDSVVVYTCVPAATLAERIAVDPDDWSPFRGVQTKTFLIPGCIVGVEFLNATDSNENEVVMIVVTASGKKSHIWCLAWDAQAGPGAHRVLLCERPLNVEQEPPCNLIIPLTQSPDFLLVHGATINLYTQVLTGEPQVCSVINKRSNWEEEPLHPASSKRRPHFTAWTRPNRIAGFKSEWLYLIREDGAVRHYSREGLQSSGIIGNVGVFACNIDRAVTSFWPDVRSPDYLIAAGDLSRGEFLSLGQHYRHLEANPEHLPREHAMSLVRRASLYDWAPAMDIQLLPSVSGRSTPYITSGRQPHGAISELRVGYESQIFSIADLGDLYEGLTGAYAMWTVEDPEGTVHYVCAYPGVTLSVYVDDFHLESSVFETVPDLVLAEKTEAGLLLLVGAEDVLLQAFLKPDLDSIRPHTFHSDANIIAASLSNDILFVAMTNRAGGSHVQYFRLNNDSICIEQCAGGVIDLETEITALATFRNRSHVLGLVACRDGSIRVVTMRLDTSKGYEPQATISILTASLGPTPQIVQSMEVVQTASATVRVICGTRDGHLLEFRLENLSTDTKPPRASLVRRTRIEDGPVQAFLDGTDMQRLYLVCGEQVLAAQLLNSSESLELTSIYFTNDDDLSVHRQPLAALRVSHAFASGGDRILASHDGQRLRLSRLRSEKMTLPRRTPLPTKPLSAELDQLPQEVSGTPTRLLYSTALKAQIVSGIRYELRPHPVVPRPAWQGQRLSRGFVTIMPRERPRPEIGMNSGEAPQSTQLDFAPGERVLGFCEWRFANRGHLYHYIIVSTTCRTGRKIMVDGQRQPERKNKLYFLDPRRRKDGSIELQIRTIKDLLHPIRALAQILDGAESHLIVAPEGHLQVYRMNDDQKIKVVASCQLPYSAHEITTKGPLIFLSTTREPGLTYEFLPVAASTAPSSAVLQPYSQAGDGSKGLTHLVVNIPKPASTTPTMHHPTTGIVPSQSQSESGRLDIVLRSDRDGALIGHLSPNIRTYQTTAPTFFEVITPQCVTKFVQGSTYAPWNELTEPPFGVLADDILGIATDGTLYHLTIVNHAARSLLKFAENLIEWARGEAENAALKEEQRRNGFTSEKLINDDDIPRVVIDPDFVNGAHASTPRKDLNGIYGDVLECLLAPDGTDQFLTMLHRPEVPLREDAILRSRFVGNQTDARQTKFLELVANALDPSLRAEDGVREETLRSATEDFVKWLRLLFRDVL